MADSVPNLAAIGYALVALAHTLLAGRLLIAPGGQGTVPRRFVAAVSLTALWGWASLAALQWDTVPLAASTGLLDLLRYGAWFWFLLGVLKPARVGSGAANELSLLAPVAAALLATVLLASAGVGAIGTAPSWLGRATLFGWLALPVLGLILVEQLFRNVTDDSRWNAKPLCLALACVFVFDLYHHSQAVLFGGFDPDALAIRGAVHALAAPLLYIASRRHADWIGRLQVSRSAIFHSATLLLAGIYLVFVSAIGYYVRYFGGEWGRALQLGLLALGLLALTVLLLSGAMRARLRVLLGKHLFRYRYDYREQWLRFTALLSAQRSPQEMGLLVVQGLADMVESPAGSLWSKRPGDSEFSQTARWNQPAVSDKEPAGSPLCAFLARTGWILDANEYRSYPGRYEHLPLPPWWDRQREPWLVVPLAVADELIGFVVLAQARTRVEVNWEVTDLLKTAARQAASFLAQMQATEALLEARKFDAFNRMSAFVVHDLKNIVTQLSLMLANAKRLGHDPEFQQDMLMTVESSLDKMRQLMMQLREGQAPTAGVHGVDLSAIATRLADAAQARGHKLELTVAQPVRSRGHDERIERVLGHMVQNAFDATPGTGRVWLRLERAGSQARIEIGDTGHGMSQEFIETRLFRPFQTTKDQGMGIGSYESFQYVKELGGSIDVRSSVNQGTVLTVLLPLLESHRESDLYTLGAK